MSVFYSKWSYNIEFLELLKARRRSHSGDKNEVSGAPHLKDNDFLWLWNRGFDSCYYKNKEYLYYNALSSSYGNQDPLHIFFLTGLGVL